MKCKNAGAFENLVLDEKTCIIFSPSDPKELTKVKENYYH